MYVRTYIHTYIQAKYQAKTHRRWSLIREAVHRVVPAGAHLRLLYSLYRMQISSGNEERAATMQRSSKRRRGEEQRGGITSTSRQHFTEINRFSGGIAIAKGKRKRKRKRKRKEKEKEKRKNSLIMQIRRGVRDVRARKYACAPLSHDPLLFGPR